jgi:hypothetical protein
MADMSLYFLFASSPFERGINKSYFPAALRSAALMLSCQPGPLYDLIRLDTSRRTQTSLFGRKPAWF